MKKEMLLAGLADLPIRQVRFFERIDSTNSEAARWIEADAPDLALVVADEQTAGRGRQGRKWFTPPGAALAFSLILREPDKEIAQMDSHFIPALSLRLTALGAMAVCQAVRKRYNLQAEIKWPNDVLLVRRKLAGVLVEAQWQGDQLQAAILGIGINIAPDSVPVTGELAFPATCLQNVLRKPVDRIALLHDVLAELFDWRYKINEPDFLNAWEELLAFKGEWIEVFENSPAGSTSCQGLVLGLDEQGRLRLKDHSGEEFGLLTGELRLRPVAS